MGMGRQMRMVAFALLAIALIVPSATVLVPSPAIAQDQVQERPRGGLLRFLFNRRERREEVREAPQPEIRERRQQRRTERRREGGGSQQAARPRAPAAPPAVVKSETAKRVLVVGDFVAGGLAEGLEEAYAQSVDVVVISRTNGSSGLVRDDYYDWPGTIGAIIDEEKPDIVVVQLGGNDRQEMGVAGNREQPRSEAWMTEYERRVRLMASEVRDSGTALVWAGTIPFRFSAMSADMFAFNDIYRRVAEETGGEFVDVWDGFVDENGAFTASGPDMNGQPAQLRASDGINITRAGKRKLAFYVEKPLGRLLGTGAPAVAAVYGPEIPPGFLDADGAVRAIERTLPVGLADADLPAVGGLMGASVLARSPVSELDGERLERREGRADDFRIAPASARPVPAPAGTDPEPTTAVTP